MTGVEIFLVLRVIWAIFTDRQGDQKDLHVGDNREADIPSNYTLAMGLGELIFVGDIGMFLVTLWNKKGRIVASAIVQGDRYNGGTIINLDQLME